MNSLIAQSDAPGTPRRLQGVTLIEILMVVAIIGTMAAIAGPNLNGWLSAQEIKTSARAVANAFALGRSEAMRTGQVHIVTFGVASLTNADADVVIARDGTPENRDCSFATADIVHRISLDSTVTWGTTATLAGNTTAPGDSGGATGNISAGSSFTLPSSATPASWVIFEPDGIPRSFQSNGASCTSYGLAGEAAGAIYITNGERDYAIVLTALGTTRITVWATTAAGWRS